MSAQTAALQRTIDTEKESISRGLDALEEKARAMVDWREPIRARPLDAVGLALLGGGILALLVGGGRRKAPRASRPPEAEPQAPVLPLSNGAHSPAPTRPHGIRTRVAEALTTLAVAKAADIFRQVAPGGESTPKRANYFG